MADKRLPDIPRPDFNRVAGVAVKTLVIDPEARRIGEAGPGGSLVPNRELDALAREVSGQVAKKDDFGNDWAAKAGEVLTQKIKQDPSFGKKYFPEGTAFVHVNTFLGETTISAYSQKELDRTNLLMKKSLGERLEPESGKGKSLTLDPPPRRGK